MGIYSRQTTLVNSPHEATLWQEYGGSEIGWVYTGVTVKCKGMLQVSLKAFLTLKLV